MNKKLLMILIPVAAILVAAIGVLTYVLVAVPSTDNLYLEQIQYAERLMKSGDVDSAILYYKNAIAQDDTRDEAYLALADLYYVQKNDLKMALDILFEGFGKTNSVALQNAINNYVALSEEGGLEQTEIQTDLKNGSLSESLMSTFSTATYQTYSTKYTMKSEHNYTDTYTVEYSQFDAEFEYKNSSDHPHVVDTRSGKPYPNSRPTAIRMKKLTALINGVETGVTTDDLRAGGAHDILVNAPGNAFKTYYVSFVYANCKCYVESDENGVISKTDAVNYVVPPAAADITKATLAGRVLNADTNRPIENVTVNIRSGKGAKTGTPVETLEAESGEFSIELDPGDYTVETIAKGFITDYYDCSLGEVGDAVSRQFVMSPELQDNQMRFVVEWTNTQYDLYIHIKGNSSSNEYIQYWEYGNSSGNVSQNIGGFETGSREGQRFTSATITDSRGDYEFHVHGGKTQYEKDDLYKANVVVKIYKDNDSSPTVVSLPSSISLSYWQVCRVHDGEITMID